MKTIAAKMTDVPGHTRAIVPYMVKNGLKFLHLGVNPASSVPEVPPLFRWRTPTGEELVVMYNEDYGEFTEIGDSGIALYFAHTGDNCGPQSAEEIRELYGEIHKKYPTAKLRAGTLEDVAQIALGITDLPVVTEEIGDSWIYGVGTDPGKVSQYRALLRQRRLLPPGEGREVNRKLLLIPEHTWGLCYKRFLGYQLDDGRFVGEHNYYVRAEFEKMRPTEKLKIMEESWQEQRDYLTTALEAFPEASRETTAAKMGEYKRAETDTAGFAPVPKAESVKRYDVELMDWRVSVGPDGSIVGLEHRECSMQMKTIPWAPFCMRYSLRKTLKDLRSST